MTQPPTLSLSWTYANNYPTTTTNDQLIFIRLKIYGSFIFGGSNRAASLDCGVVLFRAQLNGNSPPSDPKMLKYCENYETLNVLDIFVPASDRVLALIANS